MKVLLLGGNIFSARTCKEPEGAYDLRVTDIVKISPHETMRVDVSDLQVREAARGTDVIVNCSVLRPDRKSPST